MRYTNRRLLTTLRTSETLRPVLPECTVGAKFRTSSEFWRLPQSARSQ